MFRLPRNHKEFNTDPNKGIDFILKSIRGLQTTDTFVFVQSAAASTWTITHNMGKKPSVTVVDSADNQVVGDVEYIDNNTLTVTFCGSFSGKAYLN